MALILRDLAVLRKNFGEFVARTLIQPFLLVFVFLYVFPTIGQGVGGGGGRGRRVGTSPPCWSPAWSAISIMFQGIQSVALQMSTEFGYTREIEDRVQAPCPIWLVAMAKVLSGAVQGMIAAVIVFPIAAVVHAHGVHAHLSVHWCDRAHADPARLRGDDLARAAARHDLRAAQHRADVRLRRPAAHLPRRHLLPVDPLAPVQVGGFHWLQTLVLVNPLIYVNEGMRAGFTDASHMHLYVVYPVLIGFCALFLGLGLRNFRRRVLV